jgi:hypothetical protein
MANTFYRKLSANIGTTSTAVGGYTVGADTTTVVVGLSVCNRSGSTISVDIAINDATNTPYYIVKSAPISAGGSLVAVGGEQKLILTTGDNVKVTSDSASSVDAVLSIMEIT